MAETTLFEQFKKQREEHGGEAAFLIGAGDRSVPISWREFTDDIEAIAYLIQQHIPGAVIGLLGENSYEWMTAHVACTFGGACVVPLEAGLSAEELAERLVFTGAKLLVHSVLHAEKAKAVKKLLPNLMIGGFGSRVADRLLSFAHQKLEAGAPGVFDQPPRDEDETAMIVFTSGTTSKPRGAELTLHGIRTFSDFSAAQLNVQQGDRSLMLLPLHHIFGVCTTYMMLAHGVALGVCPDFRRIYDAVERFRAQYLFLVPALAELLAMKISQHGASAEEALGAPLHWIVIGGAPCPGRTYELLMSLGIQPLGGYGLTETTSLYSIEPVDSNRRGCAGQACHGKGGMEARVSPDGILQLRGPAVLKGYYKEPVRTADVLDGEGWFSTGDYGRIDEEGFVWITGRASRTIILSSGKKVAPEELEERLMSLPGIREVLVSGDPTTREVKAEVYAVVSEETVRRQIDLANKSLPLYKRIRQVIVRTEPFPRTSSGKIKVSTPKPATPVAAVATPPMPSTPCKPVERRHRNLFIAPVRKGLSMLSIRRWKWVVITLAVLAALVIFWNFFGRVLLADVKLSDTAKGVLRTIEESGEFALALFVLIAAVVVWQTGIFKAKASEKKEQDDVEE